MLRVSQIVEPEINAAMRRAQNTAGSKTVARLHYQPERTHYAELQ
jgi:hypothetical protein